MSWSFRGFQSRRNIREKRLIVADDFQLDQLPYPRLARQAAGAHGVVGVIAARGVREDCVFLRVEIVEQVFFIRIGNIDAAHGDGDDFGAGDFDGFFRFGEVFVFSGADDEPRTELRAG